MFCNFFEKKLSVHFQVFTFRLCAIDDARKIYKFCIVTAVMDSDLHCRIRKFRKDLNHLDDLTREKDLRPLVVHGRVALG